MFQVKLHQVKEEDMFKMKYFSTKHDFKTGIISKLCFIIGIIFLILAFILNNIFETLVALSIISFAIGIILHFLNLQFIKLDDIAKDIEQMEKNEE